MKTLQGGGSAKLHHGQSRALRGKEEEEQEEVREFFP